MKPEEMNVAVAELMGWRKKREIEPGEWVWLNTDGELRGQICIPNFYGDLNACFEMRKLLNTTAKRDDYCKALCNTVCNDARKLGTPIPDHDDVGTVWAIVDATAPQHCEAFLRVMSGYKEEPEPKGTKRVLGSGGDCEDWPIGRMDSNCER